MPPERNVVRVHECSRGRFDSEVSKIIRRGCERLALLWDTLE